MKLDFKKIIYMFCYFKSNRLYLKKIIGIGEVSEGFWASNKNQLVVLVSPHRQQRWYRNTSN